MPCSAIRPNTQSVVTVALTLLHTLSSHWRQDQLSSVCATLHSSPAVCHEICCIVHACVSLLQLVFFFFLVKDVAKSTLPLSVLTSTVWTPAYYFFVQWEGQPLAHPHSKVTRLGGMSETASYNTMMQDPVWCSGQKQLCVCVCVCVLHHCSPFVMSLPVL